MKLCHEDIKKVNQLKLIRQQNNHVGWMLSDYLNNTPCLITEELMMQADCNGFLSQEMVYCAFLTSFCRFNGDTDEYIKQLERDYFCRAVKKLDKNIYAENAYYKNIHIPDGVKFGNWELKYEKYKPYEAFIYNDIILEPDFKEIPCIGFFSEEFSYPMIMEHDREWMAIKPSEIETMNKPINLIEGNVVTFGLGLGYFVYMASLKNEIRNITVVECNREVIQFFKRFILPQFQHKEKIEIVSANAYEYTERQMPQRRFDYAFVNLWHDASDGLNLYLKMKKMEHFSSHTKFLYWVEDTLISGFRWKMFDWVIENARSYDEISLWLSKPFLQKLAIEADDFKKK